MDAESLEEIKNVYDLVIEVGTYPVSTIKTAEAVKGIYYLCNAIPTVCYALIIIGIGLIFNLDKKKTDQMYAEMAAKRAAK